jgi:hypothetical protein
MTPRSRKVAVFVGTAALAAGAGIGVAASGNSDAATTRSAPGMMRGGGGGGDLSTLADELGVSETRLREAMESMRTSGRPQDLAAALADELGVSEAKVRDALERALPGPPRGGGAPPDAPQDGSTRQS